MKYSGINTTLAIWNDTNGFQTIAQIRDIVGPGRQTDVIDLTTRDDADQHHNMKPGLKGMGEVTFDIIYDPELASHDASSGLVAMAQAGTKGAWRLLLPNGEIGLVNAIVTGFNPKAPMNDAFAADLTMTAEYLDRGASWTVRTSAADNNWYAVAYGNGLFVAVGITGTGNRVMTSPDGVTWTNRSSAADNQWQGVTYGNGLFVAVAATGTGTRVMTAL